MATRFRAKNLKFHLRCHTVILHWYACGAVDGVGQAYGQVITKISRMDRLPTFLRYGAPLLGGLNLEKM